MRRVRTGFTLLEVMMALALTGLVALMAHRFLSVAMRGTAELRLRQRQASVASNSRAWLAATFLALEAGEKSGNFTGLAERVEFSTWVQRAGGWMEPARVRLGLREGSLVADGVTIQALRLIDSVDAVEFDYLLEPGADTRWVRQWISPVSAPLAVRLRVKRSMTRPVSVDTILLLIRERG